MSNAKEMKDVTIIIPVHTYDKNVKELLSKAIDSANGNQILVSCFSGVKDDIWKDFSKKVWKFVESDDSTFQSLVNLGVENVDTKWFSILEFDDTYTDIWFRNVEKYAEFNPEVSVFMPLTDLFEYSEGKFIGYGNEAAWASSFSNEIGFVDNDCLQNFFDFYMTGSVFNTNDWKEIGGLKKSIKLTFWYEYLLRATYNGQKVMVVPRVGYVHNLNRDGSLIKTYSETVSESESKAWIDLAKTEYFFKKDRGKTIENNEED